MDRLRSLKVPDIDSSFYSNTSQGGYETANDDSGNSMSLYFSINNGDDDENEAGNDFSINNGDDDENEAGNDCDGNNEDDWNDISSASSVILIETNEEETLMNSMASGGGDSGGGGGGDSGSNNDFTITDINNDVTMINDEQCEGKNVSVNQKWENEKDFSVDSEILPSVPTISITGPTDSLISFLIEEEKSKIPTQNEMNGSNNEIIEMINIKPTTQQAFDNDFVSNIVKSPSWSPQANSNHILSQSSFNEVTNNLDSLCISKTTTNNSQKLNEPTADVVVDKIDNLTKNILNTNENKENQQQQRSTINRSISYNINKRRTVLRLSGIMENPSEIAEEATPNKLIPKKSSVTISNKRTTRYSLAARKFVPISPKLKSSTVSVAAAAAGAITTKMASSTGAIPKIPNRRTSTHNAISASPKLVTTRTSKRRSTAVLNNTSASPKPISKLSTRRQSTANLNIVAPTKPTATRTTRRQSTAAINIVSTTSKSLVLSNEAIPSRSSKRKSTDMLNLVSSPPKHSSVSSSSSSSSRPAKRRSTTVFNVVNATVVNTIKESTTKETLNRRSVRKSILNMKPISSTTATASGLVTIIQKSPNKFLKPSTFNCKICNKSFLQLSKLNAHEIIHNFNNNNNKNLKSEWNVGIINSCQYCDKKFAKKTALDKHLQENCNKISSIQRRKLLFQVVNSTKQQQQQNLEFTSTEQQYRRSQRLANTLSSTSPANSDCSSLSGSSTPHAHSGIYRTPNKKIMCHQCNISFSNMVLFLEHTETHPENEFET